MAGIPVTLCSSRAEIICEEDTGHPSRSVARRTLSPCTGIVHQTSSLTTLTYQEVNAHYSVSLRSFAELTRTCRRILPVIAGDRALQVARLWIELPGNVPFCSPFHLKTSVSLVVSGHLNDLRCRCSAKAVKHGHTNCNNST